MYTGPSQSGFVPLWQAKSCCSVAKSLSNRVSDSLQPHGLQHAKSPCPLPSPGVSSNSCPFELVMPFNHLSLCHLLLLLPSISQDQGLFQWIGSSISGQSVGTSASALVLPMNIQNWFPLRLTGLISLLFKGLSRVFSNATVQRHRFFSAKPSLWSSSQALWSKSQLWLLKTKTWPIFKDSCNVVSSFLLMVSFGRTNWPSCLQKVLIYHVCATLILPHPNTRLVFESSIFTLN